MVAPPPQVPPQPAIRTLDSPKVATWDIDAADYGRIAQQFYASLVSSQKAQPGSVIALGPITIDMEPGYRFDARTLQEEIQTVVLQSGRFEFSFAVDAMQDNDAATSRYKVMSLQYEKESSVDPQDMVTFGRLAKIDHLIFGRVWSQTTDNGNFSEVTFTFQWRMGRCEDGLLVWADKASITKTDR